MDQNDSNIPSPAPSEPIRVEQYNMRNPSVKRILAEARELGSANEEFAAQPLEENIFEWHFTFRGPADSDFDVGIYHGRIILPPDYPMNPPAFIMLTPNGRFEVGKKICLSISSYHPETWRPCWSIRTAVAALVAFMNTSSPGAIGSLECSSEQRRAFARKSLAFECPQCGPCADMITYTRQGEGQSSPEISPPVRSNTQRLFRIPHSAGVLTDGVIRPEEITANQDGPIFMPFPDQLGDNGDVEVDHLMEWQFAAGIRAHGHAPEPIDESPAFGVTIGVILIAIAGILIRRFFWDSSWDDILGLE